MKSKHIKLIFELSFIFILPIIYCSFLYSLTKTYSFNDTGVVEVEKNSFESLNGDTIFSSESPIYKIVDLFYSKLCFNKSFSKSFPFLYDYPCFVLLNFVFWHCIFVLLDFIPHLIRRKEKD